MCEEYGTTKSLGGGGYGSSRKAQYPRYPQASPSHETINYNREDDFFQLSSRDRQRRLDDDVFKVSRNTSLIPDGIDRYCNQLTSERRNKDLYKSTPDIHTSDYRLQSSQRPIYRTEVEYWPRAASRPSVNRTLESYQRSEARSSEPYGIPADRFQIPAETMRAEDYDILTPSPPRLSVSDYERERDSELRSRHYDLPPIEREHYSTPRYYDQVPYNDYPLQPRIVPYTGTVESWDEVNERYYQRNLCVDECYNRYYFSGCGSPYENGLRGILKRSETDGYGSQW